MVSPVHFPVVVYGAENGMGYDGVDEEEYQQDDENIADGMALLFPADSNGLLRTAPPGRLIPVASGLAVLGSRRRTLRFSVLWLPILGSLLRPLPAVSVTRTFLLRGILPISVEIYVWHAESSFPIVSWRI